MLIIYNNNKKIYILELDITRRINIYYKKGLENGMEMPWKFYRVSHF